MVNKENEERVKVCEIIKENLNELSIPINIVKVSSEEFYNKINAGDFDLALANFELQNEFDIVELLNNKKYSKYYSEEMKEALEKIYLNNISIKEDFKNIQKIYKKELPYIGLYYKNDVLLTNKAVKGEIMPTWWNIYNNIWTWHK